MTKTFSKWVGFASSKICSYCHHKLDGLPLLVRHWTCPSQHGRNVNATLTGVS